MSGPKNAVLDRWLAGGQRPVLLPSGVAFRIRIPDPEELLVRGLLPENLRSIALKFGASSVTPETLDTDALAELLQFMRSMVAYSLKSIWNGPEPQNFADLQRADAPWEPVSITPADLTESSIDGDDYAALQGIVSRRFTPEQITAYTLKERGRISADEKASVDADAKAGTTSGWEPFRRERRSPDPGGAVGTVERAPERSTRRKRSVRSVPG